MQKLLFDANVTKRSFHDTDKISQSVRSEQINDQDFDALWPNPQT